MNLIPTKVSRLRESVDRDGLGRTLTEQMRRRGISASAARRIASNVKLAIAPLDYLRRRRAARGYPSVVPRDQAYMVVTELEGSQELARTCQAAFERRRAELEVPQESVYRYVAGVERRGRELIINSPTDLEPILQFATRPEVIGPVAGYMREIPVLSNVTFAWTPVNSKAEGSQLWHRDMNHPNQMHVIVNLIDVDEASGPFTFVPADRSREIRQRIGHAGGRVPDEAIPEDAVMRFTGPAGATLFVNSYACFHYGARARAKPRLILIMNFTSKIESGEGLSALYRAANRHELDDGSELRRMLLNL